MNPSSHLPRICQTVLATLLAVSLSGCGSKSDDAGGGSSTVTPPPPNAKVVTPADPPGQMELPSEISSEISGDIGGDVKHAGSMAPSTGIEMPDVAATSVIQPQYATWQELQSAAASTGQVTVVDVWSLVCEPCVKEFPGLVELHNAMGESVACMSIAIDYDGRKSKPPESYEPQVKAFLNAKGAHFDNFISRTPSDDLYAAADLDSIPAVLIFGADGKLLKKYVDAGDGVGFTYEKDIVPFVKSLLK